MNASYAIPSSLSIPRTGSSLDKSLLLLGRFYSLGSWELQISLTSNQLTNGTVGFCRLFFSHGFEVSNLGHFVAFCWLDGGIKLDFRPQKICTQIEVFNSLSHRVPPTPSYWMFLCCLILKCWVWIPSSPPPCWQVLCPQVYWAMAGCVEIHAWKTTNTPVVLAIIMVTTGRHWDGWDFG